MPIFEKLFNFNQLLRRVRFLPRPAYFNNEDLNKGFEILHTGLEEVSRTAGAYTDIEIVIGAINETSVDANTLQRQFNWTRTSGSVFYRGMRFPLTSDSGTYTTTYAKPNTTTVSPKQARPVTYFVLRGTVSVVDFSGDPALCGLFSDELPSAVQSVDVEQYDDLTVVITEDPDSVHGKICILATVYPRYDANGYVQYYRFKNTFNTGSLTYNNYGGYEATIMKSNKSLVELLFQRLDIANGNVVNELQLIRRHNLADLSDRTKARKNIGFDALVNHAQLVKAENLKDVPSKPNARYHLGLGNHATHNYGTGSGSVLRGDALPIGAIIMWSGSHLNIPANYRLCDGTNGTPNLKGRFIVGYDPNDSDYDAAGKSGGSKTHTLTVAQMPAHAHTGKTAGVSTGGPTRLAHDDTGGHNTGNSSVDFGFGWFDHTHTIPSEGGGQPHENRPPYYAMCFIMFVGYDTPTALITAPPDAQTDLTYPGFSLPDDLVADSLSTYDVQSAPLDTNDDIS